MSNIFVMPICPHHRQYPESVWAVKKYNIFFLTKWQILWWLYQESGIEPLKLLAVLAAVTTTQNLFYSTRSSSLNDENDGLHRVELSIIHERKN